MTAFHPNNSWTHGMDLGPLILIQVKGSCTRGWRLPRLRRDCDWCPQRPRQTVFPCASVNESHLGWSVSEWRGGEFSGEDCAGRRAVSIIQGKHWAAWLHALDVTKAGRTEMNETMRPLLAFMLAQLRLPPALPILSSYPPPRLFRFLWGFDWRLSTLN